MKSYIVLFIIFSVPFKSFIGIREQLLKDRKCSELIEYKY